MTTSSATTHWDPSSSFLRREAGQPTPYAVILLNQPIAAESCSSFRSLWNGAILRICADGGANRLRNAFPAEAFVHDEDEHGKDEQHRVLLPNLISGDLDSLTHRTRRFFEALYATDLQKCLQAIEDFEEGRLFPAQQQLDIVIYGGLSGRLDQTAHTLHVLWQLAAGVEKGAGVVPVPSSSSSGQPQTSPQDAHVAVPRSSTLGGRLRERPRTWVVGEGCLAWLLAPGKHTLHLARPLLGPTCGLLPFGTGYEYGPEGPRGAGAGGGGARITTRGLRWDLEDSTPCSLGGWLSTSNHLLPPPDAARGTSRVEVSTDRPVYWTVEMSQGGDGDEEEEDDDDDE